MKQESLSHVYSKQDLKKIQPMEQQPSLIINKCTNTSPIKAIPAPSIKSLLGPPKTFVEVLDSDCDSTSSEKTNESFYESLKKDTGRIY